MLKYFVDAGQLAELHVKDGRPVQTIRKHKRQGEANRKGDPVEKMPHCCVGQKFPRTVRSDIPPHSPRFPQKHLTQTEQPQAVGGESRAGPPPCSVCGQSHNLGPDLPSSRQKKVHVHNGINTQLRIVQGQHNLNLPRPVIKPAISLLDYQSIQQNVLVLDRPQPKFSLGIRRGERCEELRQQPVVRT